MQVETTSELTPPPLPPPPLPPSTEGLLPEPVASLEPTTNGIKIKVEEEEVAKIDEEAFSGKVIQITNVSPGATLQQIATLFGFLGTVTDIRMYPTEENPQIKVRLCYIKFESTEQCGVAQHLTNTVFIDKPIIVVPLEREEIPEENECRYLLSTINAYAATSGTGVLPQFFPQNSTGGLPGLPPPPIITSTTDPAEIEEIKRTIFVENISNELASEQVMAFFSGVGEVKYLRFVKDGDGGKNYAFIEFTNLGSVPTALQYNGVLFGGKCLKVNYSKNPIVKPESERIASGKNPVRKAQRDAVKRPSSVEPVRPRVFTSRSRSRSPSAARSSRRRSRSRDRRHRRSRSRTRSPPRRRRSRSRSRSRRRSPRRRSPIRRSRSRSAGKASRKRSKSKSRSKSPRRRRRSRSRDKRRRKRSGSRSTSRSPRRRKKRSKSRSKSRSASPSKKKSSRRSGSRSPDRTSSKKKKKDKDRERDKDKDKDKDKKKDKDKSKEKEKEKEKQKDEEKSDDKELKNLLNKIKTFEEKKEKKADE